MPGLTRRRSWYRGPGKGKAGTVVESGAIEKEKNTLKNAHKYCEGKEVLVTCEICVAMEESCWGRALIGNKRCPYVRDTING